MLRCEPVSLCVSLSVCVLFAFPPRSISYGPSPRLDRPPFYASKQLLLGPQTSLAESIARIFLPLNTYSPVLPAVWIHSNYLFLLPTHSLTPTPCARTRSTHLQLTQCTSPSSSWLPCLPSLSLTETPPLRRLPPL